MSEIKAYRDEDYIRGKAPITKREVRVLTIALLGIDPDDAVVDIGAGTGGLTMEAAHAAYRGTVYAVEHKEAARKLITANAEAFGARNVKLIFGKAPAVLSEVPTPINKAIIGGTGGDMEAIFGWCHEALVPGGRLVTNFVTLENAARAKACLDRLFVKVEMIQAAITRGEQIAGLTMLKAQNPIFIMTAEKAEG